MGKKESSYLEEWQSRLCRDFHFDTISSQECYRSLSQECLFIMVVRLTGAERSAI